MDLVVPTTPSLMTLFRWASFLCVFSPFPSFSVRGNGLIPKRSLVAFASTISAKNCYVWVAVDHSFDHSAPRGIKAGTSRLAAAANKFRVVSIDYRLLVRMPSHLLFYVLTFSLRQWC